MGPSQLTADDLVAYIDSLHLHPQLTVPLRTLAGYYISEGNAEGVRGDVAFAQSILETGAFMFPGHGLVVPTTTTSRASTPATAASTVTCSRPRSSVCGRRSSSCASTPIRR